MQERLIALLVVVLLAYAAFNEYRFRYSYNIPHIAWDAETAVCHVVPEHCK